VNRLTAEDVQSFLKAVPAEFRYAEINLNTFNNVTGNGFEFRPNLTHELDLIESYPNLRKGYAENTKRNVKKSEQQNLQILFNPSDPMPHGDAEAS